MLDDIFDSGRIKLNLESTTKDDVFEELIETIVLSNSKYNRKELFNAVNKRESKMNTIILPGIAVPHGYCDSVPGIIGAIGYSRTGIRYDAVDQAPVHLFFMLLMDESSREQHLQALSQLMELLNSAIFRGIRETETPRGICELLCRF